MGVAIIGVNGKKVGVATMQEPAMGVAVARVTSAAVVVVVAVGGRGVSVAGGAAVGGGSVVVGGCGVAVGGKGVGVLVGAGVDVGGGSVAVAVGVAVGVGGAQMSEKRTTGNRPTVALVTAPHTQAFTSPSRTVRFDPPRLEYFQSPSAVRYQYDQ